MRSNELLAGVRNGSGRESVRRGVRAPCSKPPTGSRGYCGAPPAPPMSGSNRRQVCRCWIFRSTRQKSPGEASTSLQSRKSSASLSADATPASYTRRSAFRNRGQARRPDPKRPRCAQEPSGFPAASQRHGASGPTGRLQDERRSQSVSRENGKRRVVVTANVRYRDVASVVDEARRQIGAKVTLPSGYWLSWGGQFENLVAARQRLQIVVPLCFLSILLLLFGALGSVRDALLVFSAVPLALTGGVLALWLRACRFRCRRPWALSPCPGLPSSTACDADLHQAIDGARPRQAGRHP